MSIQDLTINCQKDADKFTISVRAQLDDVDHTAIDSSASIGMEYVTNKRVKAISKAIAIALEDVMEKVKLSTNQD